MRKLAVIAASLMVLGALSGSQMLKWTSAVTAQGTGDMWVILDPGHGKNYGSDYPNGTWTGFQLNNVNEDMQTLDIMSRTQQKLGNRQITPEWIMTARLRVASPNGKLQGVNAEKDVADWDGNKKGWQTPAPDSSNPNLSASVDANKTQANYDRAQISNNRPPGSHTPGKVLFSLHFDSRAVSVANRGTIIHLPCFRTSTPGPNDAGATPPTCPGNQWQYSESAKLACYVCKYLNRIRGWPGCRLADWATNYTVLRAINDTIPGVLVELMNQRDPYDAALVPGKNDAIADAFRKALQDYYNGAPL